MRFCFGSLLLRGTDRRGWGSAGAIAQAARRSSWSGRRPVSLLLPALSIALLETLVIGPARAQVPLLPDEVERIDVIAIERDVRDLFAFDALTGRRSAIRLEIAENVLFQQSRGRVGIVLTDRRVLGVAPGTGWLETRLLLQEQPAELALVEDRLALVVTNRRALAFVGGGGWVDELFTPNEHAEAIRAGAAAGVVATNRRALGIAPSLPRFVAESLRVREQLESVSAQDTLVTLRTDRRILVFSAPRAFWSEQKRRLN